MVALKSLFAGEDGVRELGGEVDMWFVECVYDVYYYIFDIVLI